MGQSIFTRWKCGKCQRWNLIEDSHCGRCGSEQATSAAVYRDEQKLTTEEAGFYSETMPTLAREVKRISSTLARIEELLYHVSNKGCSDDSGK